MSTRHEAYCGIYMGGIACTCGNVLGDPANDQGKRLDEWACPTCERRYVVAVKACPYCHGEGETRQIEKARLEQFGGVLSFAERQHIAKIERTLRHADGTRRTEVDSWLNAYQDDVRWLLTKLGRRP